jgi:hypothetical protein
MEDEVVSVEVSEPPLQRGEGGISVSGKSEQNPQSLRDSSFAKELIGYSPVISDNTVDLTISSTYMLDAAIRILQDGGHKIKSIKPKSGRLEEFFLKSTGK